MKKILKFLRNKWTLRCLGVVASSLLIWFVGPLIAIADFEPLSNVWVRASIVVLLFILLAAAYIWSRLQAEKSDRQMMNDLSETDGQSETNLSAEEVQILQQRFAEALDTLKKSRRKGRHDYSKHYLYELPWYIIIGPPGSGKTTLLINSDLEFPLADQFGKDAVAGVGGTRNCDWWFTDDAILLDTAGRYTTQDSHGQADADAWLGFLDLLKKHRPRRPINGVMVAISLADSMTQTEQERHMHAMAVRARVQEIHERLGIRFPIYLLLTKCDLVAGFTELFEGLGREERAQVWGTTFLLADSGLEGDVIKRFAEEYDALMERINARLLSCIQNERDPDRRALMFGFPQQLMSLKDPIQRFMREAFKPNRFQNPPLLRGVYITSGTQEGTPIDRLMGTLAENFGLDRTSLPSFSGIGRSYFINNLFRRVIFPESNLVGTDHKVERIRRWIRRASFAAIFLATVGLVLGWTASFTKNQLAIADVANEIENYERTAADVELATTDFERLAVPLDHLRAASERYAEDPPLLTGLGLYQGYTVDPSADGAYRRVLETRFLFSIGARLEELLQQTDHRPLLAESLKVYLMLGNPERLDPETVILLMTADWANRYPDDQDLQHRLTGHLETLLEKRFKRISVHEGLVEQTRRLLAETLAAEQIYTKIKVIGETGRKLDLTLVDLLGRNGDDVFVSNLGPLDTTAVPGLFTRKGFQTVFSPESDRLIDEKVADAWVYGISDKDAEESRIELTRDVEALYVTDYIHHWRQFLYSLSVINLRGLTNAVEVLYLVSGPSSPLRRLLKTTAEETRLSQAAQDALAKLTGGSEAATSAIEVAASMNTEAQVQRQRIKKLLRAADQAGVKSPVIADGDTELQRVDEESLFNAIQELVEPDKEGKSEVDFLISDLQDLHAWLLDMSDSYDPEAEAIKAIKRGKDPTKKLRDHANKIRNPVRNWINALSERSKATVVGLAKEELSSQWKQDVLPFCNKAINGRYPFKRNAPRETTLSDFAQFFAPGKKFDKFFQEHIWGFVDTSVSPWRWRTVDQREIGMSGDSLSQFERAARIRDAFFPEGGTLPTINFTVTPIHLDSGSLKFQLDVDGQKLKYGHGPARPSRFVWPAPGAVGSARAVFENREGKTVPFFSKTGDWAWFRLLDEASIRVADSPDQLEAAFEKDDHEARIEIRADSVINPFMLPDLENFQCPPRL